MEKPFIRLIKFCVLSSYDRISYQSMFLFCSVSEYKKLTFVCMPWHFWTKSSLPKKWELWDKPVFTETYPWSMSKPTNAIFGIKCVWSFPSGSVGKESTRNACSRMDAGTSAPVTLKARLFLTIQCHLGLNEPNIIFPPTTMFLEQFLIYFSFSCILVLGSPGYHVLLEQNWLLRMKCMHHTTPHSDFGFGAGNAVS